MVAAPRLERVTVTEAVTRYLRDLERAVLGQSLSETTANNYRRDLTEFVALAGAETILDDMTSSDLDDVVLAYMSQPDRRFKDAETSGKTRGPGAGSRFRQSVSGLFGEATDLGWVEHNPVPRMKVKPRQRPVKEGARTALPESSAIGLIEASQNGQGRADQRLSMRDLFILSLLIEAGPRVSELCNANQSDLFLRDDGTAWLHVTGKGNKPRDIPMSSTTYSAYLTYIANERPLPAARVKIVDGEPVETVGVEDAEVALLLTRRGRRMTPRDVQLMVERTWKRLPARLRRATTPHGLRHTAATLLLASGAADVKTVRDILGHLSLATTGIYLDVIDADMSRAVEAHPVTGAQSSSARSDMREPESPRR